MIEVEGHSGALKMKRLKVGSEGKTNGGLDGK